MRRSSVWILSSLLIFSITTIASSATRLVHADPFAAQDKSTKDSGNKETSSSKSKTKEKSAAKSGEPRPKSKPLTADQLVIREKGTLPIIISAPHGGKDSIVDVPERKGEGLKKGPSGFFTGRDTGTELLARELAKEIERRMGGKPYLVIAKFHRKFIDANRPAEIAYESPNAKPTYDLYHGTLAEYCAEVHKKFGRGLFLDVHGQVSANDTIFRGTQNGKTVELLRKRCGEKAHVGEQSFFGLLNAQGLKVFPLDDSKERSGFTGGYIVQTYGSHGSHGMDAIQLEFGADYRKDANRKDAAAKVAAAVQEFAKLYLPTKEHEQRDSR